MTTKQIKVILTILSVTTLVFGIFGIMALAVESDQQQHRPNIYVPEGYVHQFNADKGDHVIIIMEPTGNPVLRCLDLGGEPIYSPDTLIWECDDADF